VRAPRLVATDLDGTLLRSDGTLSDRTARLLADVERAGVHVVFVTARPPRWLDGLAHLVAGHGTAICGNGAFVYAVGERDVVAVHGFEHRDVQGLVRDLRAEVPGILFAAERASGLWSEPGFPHSPAHPLPTDHIEAPIETLSGDPVGKLLARSQALEEDAFLDHVAGVVGRRGQLAYSGAGGLAEISAPGVTKAATLERWAADLGIGSADVWAVGDMPNDLPMLDWAGESWAVANAHRDVLAAAARRCASNDDDGVAEILALVLEKV
jgi:Cof subfamily protein (haloacid dehalogenase superfamily)